MISMFMLITGVVAFLGVAGAISLKFGRLWRQHKLPEDIQRYFPKYEPPVYGQPEATYFGIARSTVNKVADLFGTLVSALSFVGFLSALLSAPEARVG